ncbi:hypothetical protein UFOVP275_51 [uncultured Caudovirales phage]|uniref:Uncharacterized protein n=1 Tax=uncultured Caudovirales phage TaxID=2100421 RepID=A0A6J5LKA9_9CAUD|nr:hypothetical protein UFOVP275_51 [uncultured Caudovirales phage]
MTTLRRADSINNYKPTHAGTSIPAGGIHNVRNCSVCNDFKQSLGGKTVKRFGSFWFTCADCQKPKKPELTEWFSEHTPPVHVGIYQVNQLAEVLMTLDPTAIRYAYWNGKLWSYWCNTIEDVSVLYERDIKIGNTHKALSWRGLAVKP